jgi:drug/metabolite transporter (DMT)-like permease
MSKKRKRPLFYRSFHLTLGSIALLLTVLIWLTEGKHLHAWPLRAWIILFVLLIGGVCFLLFGFFASDERIGSTRIAAIPDNFLVTILAVPLYLILSGIQRRKHNRASHGKHDRVS